MGLVSHRVKKEDIQPGDHIYTWRACFTYSHHGIYVGENKVVHFTAPEDGGSKLTTSSSQSSASYCHPSPGPTSSDDASNLTTSPSHLSAAYGHPSPWTTSLHCGFKQPDSGVVLSCLDCFLGQGSPHLFEYGVTKFSFYIKRPGTCTTAQPDPSETVIHRAKCLLQQGFGEYSMLRNNCEDFAIYCKTGLLVKIGLGGSGQVSSVAAAVPPVAVLSSASVIRNAVGLAVWVAVGAGWYSMTRHEIDIGVRDDVIKVPVEMLAAYIDHRLQSRRLSQPARGLKDAF